MVTMGLREGTLSVPSKFTTGRSRGGKSGCKTTLASFPKSGSNWVRYCIEYFSGKGTPGSRRFLLHPNEELIIGRTHFLDKKDRMLFTYYTKRGEGPPLKPASLRVLYDVKKVLRREWHVHARQILLLLRDPCELYVRVGAKDPLALRGYFSNILIFDRARRPKLVKHYSDVVSDFEHIRDILDFLDIDNRGRSFDVEEHRARSLQLYKQAGDGPASAGDLLNFRYHSDSLDLGTRREIARLGRDVLGCERFRRYLSHYMIDGG